MKVLVNGTPLLAPLTGVGQYIRQLFTAMEQLSLVSLKMYYGVRCEDGMTLPAGKSVQAAQATYSLFRRLIPRPRAARKLVERAMFAHYTRSDLGRLLYHEPNFVPLPYRGPTVVTVHDLSCFDHPETHPADRVRFMQSNMPRALNVADQIIVVSDATGQALQRCFNVDPARITTTHLASDSRFFPRSPESVEASLATVGLRPTGYVLCVGTLEPRKNLPTLFAAYAKLPARLRQLYPLVLAGMSGWHNEGLMDSAAGLLSRNELRLLGYVPDALIPDLYAGAAAFCYPSRYEGFGLPALEAMASGVPVLTSNSTSLPEVVGKAGIMVDPDDVDAMSESLRQLLEDRGYAQRLGHLGLTRAKAFSWDRCARETFAVYEAVMLRRGLYQ